QPDRATGVLVAIQVAAAAKAAEWRAGWRQARLLLGQVERPAARGWWRRVRVLNVGTEREVGCTEAFLNLAAADGVIEVRVAAAGRILAQAAGERRSARRQGVDCQDGAREVDHLGRTDRQV